MSNFVFRRELFEKIDSVAKLVHAVGTIMDNRTNEIKTRLDNHLKHHEEVEKRKADKWFKVAMVAFQALLAYLVMRR